MTIRIDGLRAVEVLDSRGRPTVRAFCDIDDVRAWATAPSGASTGAHEAWERRDGDPNRRAGLGCLHAVAAVNAEIADHVVGRAFDDHRALDAALEELDGTPNLSRLGANAVLATSLATAVATARHQRIELYDHLASMPRTTPTPSTPRPMINLFSGGRHAGGQVAIQDLLVVSMADEVAEQLDQIERVYAAAAARVLDRYGMRDLTADEGGLAPDFENCDALFANASAAVESAGLGLGTDICFAIDVAASEFFVDGGYHLDGEQLSTDELIATIVRWNSDNPIVTIEDGLAEDEMG